MSVVTCRGLQGLVLPPGLVPDPPVACLQVSLHEESKLRKQMLEFGKVCVAEEGHMATDPDGN